MIHARRQLASINPIVIAGVLVALETIESSK